MNFFKRRFTGKPSKLPSGAFSLDHTGQIVSSTLPENFSKAEMKEIGTRVLSFFRGAQRAHMPLQEMNVYYPTLKLTARSIRGGALIFLSPQTLPKN